MFSFISIAVIMVSLPSSKTLSPESKQGTDELMHFQVLGSTMENSKVKGGREAAVYFRHYSSEEASEGMAFEWSCEQRQREKENLRKKVFAVASLWPMRAAHHDNPWESLLGPLTLTKWEHVCVPNCHQPAFLRG